MKATERKTSVRIDDVPGEIPVDHLPDGSLERYLHTRAEFIPVKVTNLSV